MSNKTPNATAPGKTLAPCPFCGMEGIVVSNTGAQDSWCQCYSCLAIGPSQPNADAAVDAWNKRAQEKTPSKSNVVTLNFYPLGKGVADIVAERRRQVEVEGYTAEHDDFHNCGVLSDAAVAYLIEDDSFWPFEPSGFKPTDQRRNLVKAGALIAAAIDCIDRQSSAKGKAQS